MDWNIFFALAGLTLSSVTLACVCYMADKALERRARNKYNETWNWPVPSYPHNDDVYSFKPTATTPQLVMCGGCGHNIEPGSCPGAENCPHFSIIKVAPGA